MATTPQVWLPCSRPIRLRRIGHLISVSDLVTGVDEKQEVNRNRRKTKWLKDLPPSSSGLGNSPLKLSDVENPSVFRGFCISSAPSCTSPTPLAVVDGCRKLPG